MEQHHFITIGISCLALIISTFSFYLAHFKLGEIKMTNPNQIWVSNGTDTATPSILIKALLYTTGNQTLICSRLYAKVISSNTEKFFDIWVSGRNRDTYMAGGLQVDKTGIIQDHHFFLQKDGSTYEFSSGNFTLEIYARFPNSPKDKKLQSIGLNIPELFQSEISSAVGIHFHPISNTQNYQSSLDYGILNRDNLNRKATT